MHVLINEGRVDRAYIERATLGYEQLACHVQAYAPERVAPIVGLSADSIVGFARQYGAGPRAFIRLGIGISRHDNGGMTCRTIACLPALTGAYADPHGGALLSSGAAFGFDYAVLERPDLMPTPPPRTVNMIHLGRVLTDATLTPPITSLYVYNSNPAAVCPNQRLVLAGLAREDLFTVVHEQVMTDTAHRADLVLPATMSLEHEDLYRSYGHFHLQLALPVLAAPGETKSNWEAFALLAEALGVAREHYAKRPASLIQEFLAGGDVSVAGITYERLREEGSVRLNLPVPTGPLPTGPRRHQARWSSIQRAWRRGDGRRSRRTCRSWRAPTMSSSRRAIRCSASCHPTGSS
jgi:anaerobic selenocysteine-containing dehydrogenase